MTILQLSEPTIFPEFNRQTGKKADEAITEIQLKSLKYKHFREVIKFPDDEQMHRLMLVVTELSDEDIGELTPNDAASISQFVFESMKKYFELGKKIINSVEE